MVTDYAYLTAQIEEPLAGPIWRRLPKYGTQFNQADLRPTRQATYTYCFSAAIPVPLSCPRTVYFPRLGMMWCDDLTGTRWKQVTTLLHNEIRDKVKQSSLETKQIEQIRILINNRNFLSCRLLGYQHPLTLVRPFRVILFFLQFCTNRKYVIDQPRPLTVIPSSGVYRRRNTLREDGEYISSRKTASAGDG